MRLLNVHTLRLQEFSDVDLPPYCILSHRWGDEESSFKDFIRYRDLDRAGRRKILEFCELVEGRSTSLRRAHVISATDWEEVEIDWVWVDTVCIDKKSSSELSEAINSMFSWYSKAAECYVYLADVSADGYSVTDYASYSQSIRSQFSKSDWFRRGWTLQELIAPAVVIFCDARWTVVGHICLHNAENSPCPHDPSEESYGPEIGDEVSQLTKIPRRRFGLPWALKWASVAERMSWAAERRTTRIEDEAYCLLGLFGVNMPLLYGEGRKAFFRLQEEIIKKSADQSIFAWKHWTDVAWNGPLGPDVTMPALLAPSPRCFHVSSGVSPGSVSTGGVRGPYALTNLGLEMQARLTKAHVSHVDASESGVFYLLALNCTSNRPGRLGRGRPEYMILQKINVPIGNHFRRVFPNMAQWIQREVQELEESHIFIDTLSDRLGEYALLPAR